MVPISLRVNLETAKILHSHMIQTDHNIRGTVVRNTQMPEELGVIDYVLSDKTGTLTQNEMVFQKIRTPVGEFSAGSDVRKIRGHVGNFMIRNMTTQKKRKDSENNFNIPVKEDVPVVEEGPGSGSANNDDTLLNTGEEDNNTLNNTTTDGVAEENSLLHVSSQVANVNLSKNLLSISKTGSGDKDNSKISMEQRTEEVVFSSILCLALCHNVTPVTTKAAVEDTSIEESEDESDIQDGTSSGYPSATTTTLSKKLSSSSASSDDGNIDYRVDHHDAACSTDELLGGSNRAKGGNNPSIRSPISNTHHQASRGGKLRSFTEGANEITGSANLLPVSRSNTGNNLLYGSRKQRDVALIEEKPTPTKVDNSTWDLQGSSPDELALVKFANEAGLRLTYRDDNSITVECDLDKIMGTSKLDQTIMKYTMSTNQNVSNRGSNSGEPGNTIKPKSQHQQPASFPRGKIELGYDILACFPFSSETKRMGILVQKKSDPEGEVHFYIWVLLWSLKMLKSILVISLSKSSFLALKTIIFLINLRFRDLDQNVKMSDQSNTQI